MTKEDFIKKMENKFSHENYTILKFGKNTLEDSVIRCNACGRQITVNTGELFRTRRKNICSKCHYERVDTARNKEIVTQTLNEHDSLQLMEFFFVKKKSGNRWQYVRYFCKKCNQVVERSVADFLRRVGPLTCIYCSGRSNSIFLQELEIWCPNKFEVLSEYLDEKTNIKVRCKNCGFIQKIKPPALIKKGTCPKCEKFK